jgi:3-deoxy-7-phosphoheptulonate synthase
MTASVSPATPRDLCAEALASVKVGRTTQPLPSAAQLRDRLPASSLLNERIAGQRQAIRTVLEGQDDRLLVIAGPCSLPRSATACFW